MLEWLMTPIDPGRAHEVDFAVSWHARIMTVAWGVLAPLAVLIARYFKILPTQDWPRQLDSTFWWKSHWIGQTVVAALSVIGFALILPRASFEGWHALFGYSVMALVFVQILLGLFRGSKGGPTAPAVDGSLAGDHYDMTPRRRAFELAHKSAGYGLLLLAAAAIIIGLWNANAPRWMWLSIMLWWAGLSALAIFLQSRGRAIDTYQAIWGPDLKHPGNRMPDPGWGMRRINEKR